MHGRFDYFPGDCHNPLQRSETMKWKYITADPNVCGGKPCFRGTRIPVSLILNYIGAGEPIESVLKEYPSITRKHILEGIRFAAQLADFEELEISA
jgi:uncharacterized protein (DUF433 family)